MKLFIITIIVILFPTIVIEAFLHINHAMYNTILLYNQDFSEWRQAAPSMNYWPETIIFGTSIAKQDIDPILVQKQLRKNGITTTVGNIASNAESTSSDYLTLKRILATCKVCPKRIIYQVSDVSLRNTEVKEWKDTTLRKMLRLYFYDAEIESALQKAGTLDPYFKEYYLDSKTYASFRTAFTKQRLVSLLTNEFYKTTGLITHDIYEPNYSDQEVRNGLNGYYSYTTSMDEKTRQASLSHQKYVLENFHIGNATEFFFVETLKLAKSNNIKVYLVLTPENKLQLKTFPKEGNILREYLAVTSKKYAMPFIDDRNYKSNDDSLFYDIKHLDRKGAVMYSPYLADRLAKVWK